ncbi:hypothetical protein, partial [Phytopseudomonas dryadis]|uniref:hypothetical protein n=1 Tax=Phytopseudomonas dryadis TaxID=2487520 RepID=UPI001A95500F
HTLDPRFGTLVNPGADSLNTENASSGGYNAGGSVVTVPHTGGQQLDGQQGSGSYTTPEHQLSPGNMYSENGTESTTIPNITERGTLTNLYPADAVVAQRPIRTLIQDDTGCYWLRSSNGSLITPSGSYDFVTMPDGSIRVSRGGCSS